MDNHDLQIARAPRLATTLKPFKIGRSIPTHKSVDDLSLLEKLKILRSIFDGHKLVVRHVGLLCTTAGDTAGMSADMALVSKILTTRLHVLYKL